VLLVILGAVTAFVAAGFIAAGGGLLWADSQKDERGFISTGTHGFSASTPALVSENVDIDLDGGWIAGDVGDGRLKVTSRSGEPVFVGVAPTKDVERYLRNVAHTTVTDLDSSPFRADYREEAGRQRVAPPAKRKFWTRSAQGTGQQTLTWDIDKDDWSVVVMNADGKPGVAADISAGARVPVLDEAGWTTLGAGIVLLLGATAMIVLGARPPRNTPRRRGAPGVVTATS